MRILLTNIQFSLRSGTEIVVKELAQRLVENGHEVTIYSPVLGEIARDLEGTSVRVTDDLLSLDQAPDIIHGHHTPTTAEAICAFPQVPAVWMSHGAASWFDVLPRFSQVRRILAVDETCRNRLVISDNLQPADIEILPNAVDLRRFRERSPELPARPSSAVSLIKHFAPIPTITQVCISAGLSFQSFGWGVDRVVSDIETACSKADIVFATARTALEAMAAGAAVILVDGRGFGGLVTTANYERGRRLNFGVGMLTNEITIESLTEAINSYDAGDAMKVCRLVRRDANLDDTVARLETIYNETIQEARTRAPFDAEVFRRELVRFNRVWLPRLQSYAPWEAERFRLTSQIAELHGQQAKWLESVNTLTTLLAASEADRAERLENASKLTTLLAASEADRAQRLEHMDKLTALLEASEADRMRLTRALSEAQEYNSRSPFRRWMQGAIATIFPNGGRRPLR